MTYYHKAEDLLLAKFNTANKLNLSKEHVRFENPRPADTVDITMSKMYNTAIDVIMLPGAPYNGMITLFYNRINLRTEFGVAKLDETNYISINSELTLRECIDYINDKLGTRLAATDIVDAELPLSHILNDARLQVLPGNMLYIGNVDIKLFRANAKTVTINSNPNPLFHYDELLKRSNASRLPWVLYTRNYHINYTPALDSILRWTVTDVLPFTVNDKTCSALNFTNDPGIYTALNRVDNIRWNTKANDGACLLNAVCIYRGTTKDCNIMPYVAACSVTNGMAADTEAFIPHNPSNPQYTHVAILLTDSIGQDGTRYKSMVMFHYNL